MYLTIPRPLQRHTCPIRGIWLPSLGPDILPLRFDLHSHLSSSSSSCRTVRTTITTAIPLCRCTIRADNPPRYTFTGPVRPRRGPQGDEGGRMLTRKPDPPVDPHSFSHDLDVLVGGFHADLEVGVGPIAGEGIVLPLGGKEGGGGAGGGVGVEVGEEGVEGSGEIVKGGVVWRGLRGEIGDGADDFGGTWAVGVE